MSGSLFGLLELLLVFGLVIGFAYSQLRAVRRRDPSESDSGRDADGEGKS